MKIPVCEPTIGKEEVEKVKECVKSTWISSKGKFIDEFEERFSKYCGCRYGVTTTNGTTALHLALLSLGIGKGDEVILPTLTMIASAYAVTYTGAKPVFIDSESETWNMNVEKIEEKITNKTKAIMPVHLYGHPVDMDPLLEIAEDHNLFVIEDAAEAHGAEYKGKKVGGLGDIGCFSFYANKIITTGEGGMIVTNDEDLAKKARTLKDLAHSEEKRFFHKELGFNFRMTNIQAALGVAQLEKIDKLVEMRRNNAKLYNKLLRNVGGIKTPPEKKWAKNVYWMYAILVDENKFGMNRDELRKKLEENDIGTRDFFVPMHKQPVYKNIISEKERFPVAEKLSGQGMYLPSSSHLKKSEIEYIIEKMIEASK